MNKMWIVAAYGIILTITANGESIHAREVRQERRIREGVRSGQLTPRENAALQFREVKLHREIRRDRIDGGGLTGLERHRIDRKQDQLSREIYRQKHDYQFRY